MGGKSTMLTFVLYTVDVSVLYTVDTVHSTIDSTLFYGGKVYSMLTFVLFRYCTYHRQYTIQWG